MSPNENRLIALVLLGLLLAWAVSPAPRTVEEANDVPISAAACKESPCRGDNSGSGVALGYMQWRAAQQLLLNAQRPTYSSGMSFSRRGR